MSVFSKLDPDMITFHILPHLDGKSLIILSSVSSQFHNLISKINSNSDLWRNICISTWPSLLTNFPSKDFHSSVISVLPGGYRSFFLDAFPSIHPPLNNPLPPLPPKLFFFFAVDIFLDGEQQQPPLYSLHSAELVKKEGCLDYLKQKLTLSCVAIDPKGSTKCAGSLFSPGCKAVAAKRVVLGVEVVFETVLPVPERLYHIHTEMIKCEMKVTCIWEGKREDKFRVRLIDFTMKDMNGRHLFDRHGAVVILNAIQYGLRKARTTSTQLV
ncbi:F-box protein [Trifolium repens]|nr:F-box protein [Trifolium repens]